MKPLPTPSVSPSTTRDDTELKSQPFTSSLLGSLTYSVPFLVEAKKNHGLKRESTQPTIKPFDFPRESTKLVVTIPDRPSFFEDRNIGDQGLPRTNADTRTLIIETAEFLIQTRGYDGFSFSDLEEKVGIRKASIHHHFPTKADLGVEIVIRFRRNCQSAFEQMNQIDKPIDRLRAYADLFIQAIEDRGRMCLCGILAAGFSTLPENLFKQLQAASDDHEAWLERVIRDGIRTKSIRPNGSARLMARSFFSSLEGGMLMARISGGPKRFRAIVAKLLADFAPEPLAHS